MQWKPLKLSEMEQITRLKLSLDQWKWKWHTAFFYPRHILLQLVRQRRWQLCQWTWTLFCWFTKKQLVRPRRWQLWQQWTWAFFFGLLKKQLVRRRRWQLWQWWTWAWNHEACRFSLLQPCALCCTQSQETWYHQNGELYWSNYHIFSIYKIQYCVLDF